jgi:glucose dehydrogenase
MIYPKLQKKVFITLSVLLVICLSLTSIIYFKQKNKFLRQRNEARQDLLKIQSIDPNQLLNNKEIFELLYGDASLVDYNSPNYDLKNSLVKKEINVSQEALSQAENNSKEWMHPNGNYKQTRHYKNHQINLENVKSLKLAFTLTTGVKAQIESAPIIINGIIYVSTAFNNIYAFDGKSGNLIWHYKFQNELGDYFPYNCCGPNNKGLAVFKNKLFMGTLDGTLVCVDAISGALLWKKNIAKSGTGYSITAAPVVIDNKVIIGIGDGDFGIKGFLSAYDADTGNLIWTFKTIPEKGQEGIWATKNVFGEYLNRDLEKEKQDLKKFSLAWLGGAGVWTPPSIDKENNLVIFGTGNGWPDQGLERRPGDNLYTNSMLAVSLNDGSYKWHFQYFPHEYRNLDSSSPTVLIDYDQNGLRIPAVIQAGKSGNIFIHNRLNGELLKITERMVPQKISDEGGVTWSPVAYNPSLNYVYSINKSDNNKNIKTTGRVVATDLKSGKIAWIYEGYLINGGILSTASNLVFFGENNGNINALNALTGQKLWTYKCDAGANGVPSAYQIDNEEYIVIGCGGNRLAKSPRGNKFYVFSLNGKK